MRKRQGKKSAYILGLLALGAFILTFQLGAVGALAGDGDFDGFTDDAENAGFFLTGTGMHLAAYPSMTAIPKCPASDRTTCVDSTKQDLFVIIQRATGPCPASSCGDPCAPLFGNSNIPLPSQYANTYNPLALVYPGIPGGTTLGVTTHELIQDPGFTSQVIGGTANTVATGGWYAVKIVENLDPCSKWMGLSKFGVPYSGSLATVWPEKIKNWVKNQCSVQCFDLDGNGTAETCYTPGQAASFTCKNGDPKSSTSIDMKTNPNLTPLYYEFLRNVISHEASHMMKLASGSATSADHHYSILKGVLMEQSVGATVTKDNSAIPNITVTLYISTQYVKQDQTSHKLK